MTDLAQRPLPSVRAAPVGASFPLPRDVRAPHLARSAVRDLVASRGWPHAHDADIVVSELVTNALVHGVGRITLGLWLAEGRIHGLVADGGSEIHARLSHRDHGFGVCRGLGIVDAIADRWGVADGASYVWFELASASTWRSPD